MIRFGLLFGLLLVISCKSRQSKNDEPTQIKKELPGIMLKLTTGISFRADDLEGRTILLFFNPECDHCQRQATEIANHLDSFKSYMVYFIATDSLEVLTKFSNTYKLDNQPNIFFARSDIENVTQVMGSMGVPTMYIYSEAGLLIKKIDGETPFDEIEEFL